MPLRPVIDNPISLWKSFTWRQIREAIDHARTGGIAVHCHRIIVNPNIAPKCFVNAVARGEDIAHLFDQDIDRLRATARSLGIKVIVVEHEGEEGQHIDLCGSPLRKALTHC